MPLFAKMEKMAYLRWGKLANTEEVHAEKSEHYLAGGWLVSSANLRGGAAARQELTWSIFRFP